MPPSSKIPILTLAPLAAPELETWLAGQSLQLVTYTDFSAWLDAVALAPLALCQGSAWQHFHETISGLLAPQTTLLVLLMSSDLPPSPPSGHSIFIFSLPDTTSKCDQLFSPWLHLLKPVQTKALPLFHDRFPLFVNAIRNISSCSQLSFIHTITKEFAALTDAGGGSFFAFEGSNLVLKASLDAMQPPTKIELPLRKFSPFEWALSHKSSLMVTDIRAEQKLSPAFWGGYNDGSLIVIPLLDHSDNILALVSLHNKKNPPFQQHDLILAKSFAAICSDFILFHQLFDKACLDRDHHRALMEAAPTAMALFRPNGELLDFNFRFAKLLQREPDQLHKTTNWSLTPSDQHVVERSLFERYTLLDQSQPMQKTFLLPSGETIAVRVSYALTHTTGEPLLLSAYEPIAIIHSHENPAFSNLKLILGGFGHDLNNVLSAIIGYSDMLGDLVSDQSGKDLNKQLQASVWRFRGLLQKMLALYRTQDREVGKPDPVTSHELANATGERLLLVDDDPELSELFSRLLLRFGYQVKAFQDPHEALRCFRSSPHAFDFVITDFYMPVLDGAKLIQQLRQIRANMPILMVTGNVDDLPESMQFNDPNLVLLRKPFLPTDLHYHIQALLSHSGS